MEAPEEISMASKDHSNIIRGKRTKKRLRPQSPTPLILTSNDSIFNEKGGEFDGNSNVLNKNYTPYLSSFSLSSSEYQDSNDKERGQEEDMANCLILLAQGQTRESTKQGDDRHDRFTEAASNETTEAGYYVYECRTCNKTFSSFQALGGHRTGHTKPKASQFKTITPITTAASNEEQSRELIKTNTISSLSLQISSHNKAKVHECSICGAEFSSGQALGGHMRRHRGPIGNNMVDNIIVNPTLSLTTSVEIESQQSKKSTNASSLGFDLNLPAPEEDHRESKFLYASKQQQQQQQKQSPFAFNAPTLVDCHY